MIFLETRHHTQAHITSGAVIHLPFLSLREEHKKQHIWFDDFAGQCLLWRLLSRRTFIPPALPTNLGGGAILALYSSPNKIPHRRA